MNTNDDLKNKSETKFQVKGANINEYDNIILSINSGIISHIHTMIVSCVSDFGGYLLGKYKIVENNNENNRKTLLMNIDQAIAIYDKLYLNKKLEKLLSKIMLKYPTSIIISVFTAKAFSFSSMSIKDQAFYFQVNDYMHMNAKMVTPLLFSTFVHNSMDKHKSFNTVFYTYDQLDAIFKTVNYEINNLKYLSNKKKLNANPNRASNIMINKEAFESQVELLRHIINNSLNEIELVQLKTLKEIKVSIKAEIEEFNSSVKKNN